MSGPSQRVAITAVLMLPLASAAAGETLSLPKPGFIVEWRQTAHGHRTQVRQEIVAVNGAVVSHRESVAAMELPATAYDTWRGLILIKRHTPQSSAYTEAILSFTVDLPALEGLLPLEPGRRLALAVKGRGAARLGVTATAPFRTMDLAAQLTIAVERREAIHVPAGRFETIVVRHQVAIEEVGMDKRSTVAARIWLAPALGWPVKKQQLNEKGQVEGEAVLLTVRGR